MLHGESKRDPFFELKRSYGDYKVFDAHYKHIGKVDDLFVDKDEQMRYIGVKTGLLSTSFTPIPVEIIRVNDKRRVVEVSDSKDKIEHAPNFEGHTEITPEVGDRVRSYFGLEPLWTPLEQKPPGDRGHIDETALADDERVDLIPGERQEPRYRPEPTSRRPEGSVPEPGAEPGAPDERRESGAPRVRRLRR